MRQVRLAESVRCIRHETRWVEEAGKVGVSRWLELAVLQDARRRHWAALVPCL